MADQKFLAKKKIEKRFLLFLCSHQNMKDPIFSFNKCTSRAKDRHSLHELQKKRTIGHGKLNRSITGGIIELKGKIMIFRCVCAFIIITIAKATDHGYLS